MYKKIAHAREYREAHPKEEIKCVCLNARSIINKNDELNIMVDDIQPQILLFNYIMFTQLSKSLAKSATL